jgi:hypothetical protein
MGTFHHVEVVDALGPDLVAQGAVVDARESVHAG